MSKLQVQYFINQLTPYELKKLEDFINSPFFNTRPKMNLVFNSLTKTTGEKPISKQELFAMVYNGQEYNDVKFRRLLSYFNELCKKFLGYLGAEKHDDYHYKFRSLEIMKEKGMTQLFKESYKQISGSLAKSFVKNDTYYKSFANIESMNSMESVNSLQNLLNYTDLYFVFSKLHSFRDVYIHKALHVQKHSFQMRFYDEVILYVQKNLNIIKGGHPNIYIIYLSVMSLYNKHDENYVNELLTYIRKYENEFDKVKLSYYYTYATTYYWLRINEGLIKYRKNVFKLYKYLDSKNLIMPERYISHEVINSVVIAGLANTEYTWLEKFLEKYKTHIEPEFANDAYHLNLAKLFFNKGDYDKTLQHLNYVNYKDQTYYVNAKIVLIKTLYERGDIKGIKYVIDNFKHYAYRNKKLLPQQAENIKTFIAYLTRLIQIKKKGKTNSERLKKLLDNEKLFVPQKNWFYGKISELVMVT